MTRIYHGMHNDRTGDCVVIVEDDGVSRRLNPRFDLANHSPTGFSWGFGGSGPAQLALALLADATGNDAAALRHHQIFKFRAVGKLPMDGGWTMTRERVLAVLDEIVRDKEDVETCTHRTK
jgi:hypothetical protein